MKKKTEKKLLQTVKNNYEEIALHFSETRKKEIWPELKRMADQVEENSLVLDIACGNGRLLKAFAEKKIKYFGLDQSQQLIKIAQERFPGLFFINHDMLELSKLDFKKIGLPHKFDYIFLIAVLQHIPGKKRRIDFLKNLKNYLAPEAKIMVSNWNIWEKPKYKKLIYKTYFLKMLGKNDLDFGDILFDWKDSSGKALSKRYYHAFRKNELKKIFRKAGYKIEKNHKDEHNIYLIAKI